MNSRVAGHTLCRSKADAVEKEHDRQRVLIQVSTMSAARCMHACMHAGSTAFGAWRRLSRACPQRADGRSRWRWEKCLPGCLSSSLAQITQNLATRIRNSHAFNLPTFFLPREDGSKLSIPNAIDDVCMEIDKVGVLWRRALWRPLPSGSNPAGIWCRLSASYST